MPKNLKWCDSHIEIKPPIKTKKLTATRFATVLGLNPWQTPFEIWCAVTKVYEKPFEDTIYTAAGKIIDVEPRAISAVRLAAGCMSSGQAAGIAAALNVPEYPVLRKELERQNCMFWLEQ